MVFPAPLTPRMFVILLFLKLIKTNFFSDSPSNPKHSALCTPKVRLSTACLAFFLYLVYQKIIKCFHLPIKSYRLNRFFTWRTSVFEVLRTLFLSSRTSSSRWSMSRLSSSETSFLLVQTRKAQSLYSTTRVRMMKTVPWTNMQKMYLPKKSQSSLFRTDSNPENSAK